MKVGDMTLREFTAMCNTHPTCIGCRFHDEHNRAACPIIRNKLVFDNLNDSGILDKECSGVPPLDPVHIERVSRLPRRRKI